jgi:hypothetical protein
MATRASRRTAPQVFEALQRGGEWEELTLATVRRAVEEHCSSTPLVPREGAHVLGRFQCRPHQAQLRFPKVRAPFASARRTQLHPTHLPMVLHAHSYCSRNHFCVRRAQATITIRSSTTPTDVPPTQRLRPSPPAHRADAAVLPRPLHPARGPHIPHHACAAFVGELECVRLVHFVFSWLGHRGGWACIGCMREFWDAPGVTSAVLVGFCARRPLAQCLAYGGGTDV